MEVTPFAEANSSATADTSQSTSGTPSSSASVLVPPVSTIPSLYLSSTSPPILIHPMTTRLRHGITKPIQKLKLHVDTPFPMPSNYLQAFKDPNWLDTMKDEFNALVSNQMWVLVSRLAGANIIKYIWLFKKNENADGYLARYKARLVDNVRSQRPVINCD